MPALTLKADKNTKRAHTTSLYGRDAQFEFFFDMWKKC